jgi:integrase
MATVKYYLKAPKSDGNSLISLYFRYGQYQVVVSTNSFIKGKNWDASNQKAKAGQPGYSNLNSNLEKWRNEIFKIYQQRIFHNLSITPKDLKPEFEKVVLKHKFFEELAPEQAEVVGLTAFIEKYILMSKSSKNPNTIKTYNSHLKMLKDFQTKKFKRTIEFKDVTLDFYLDLKGFMYQKKNYNDNTQNKHTGLLKFFLNEAAERKLNNTFEYRYKSFSTARKEVESIYLNENEIDILIKLDLSANKRLEKVRDLFVVGCFTGLRYSDLTTIIAENITNDEKFFKIKTIKTEEYVEIPIHSQVKKIMEKYRGITPNSLPEAISNPKMNKYLKEIGELAKLDENVSYIENKGNKRIQKKANKFDLITCHTSRRSFATNEFNAGTPTNLIMAITGHRTEKAFLTYIKTTKTQKANKLLDIWEEREKKELEI